MKNDEIERLLWERFDGSLDAADRARLEEHLAGDPEARRLAEEIAAAVAELNRVSEVETPPAVTEGIREAIDRASTVRTHRPTTPGFSLLGGLLRRPEIRRLAWAAAGLLIAIVAFQLATGTVQRETGVFSGTAGLRESEVGGATSFQLPAGAELRLGRQGDELRLDLELTPGLPEARLSVAGEGLAVAESAFGDGSRFELDDRGGRFAIAAVGSGPVRLVFLVPDPKAPLEVEVRTDEAALLSLRFRLEEIAD